MHRTAKGTLHPFWALIPTQYVQVLTVHPARHKREAVNALTLLPLQAITQEHILQNGVDIKAKQAQELIQYQQSEITDPTLKYLSETLSQHLQGLQPNATEVSSPQCQPSMPVHISPYNEYGDMQAALHF